MVRERISVIKVIRSYIKETEELLDLTSLKEGGNEEAEGRGRHDVEEEHEPEDRGVTVSQDRTRLRIEGDAQEEDDDGDGEDGDEEGVEHPSQPVHPVRKTHHLHQLLRGREGKCLSSKFQTLRTLSHLGSEGPP